MTMSSSSPQYVSEVKKRLISPSYPLQVISIVYNGLAVWQTRLGLGLPLSLRPEADLAKYSVVSTMQGRGRWDLR